MEPTPSALPALSSPGVSPAADVLLDALPWGVLDVNEQRVVRRVNPQMARWCGTLPGALPGRPVAEADLPPAVRATLLQLLEPGEPMALEVLLPHSEQWITLAAIRQTDGWLLYGQDITERKQREADLRASEERQAFRVQLSDALRPLTDLLEIQATATRLLGRFLDADQGCCLDDQYATQESGAARRYLPGAWPLPGLLSGQPWVCHDVDTDPALPDEQRAEYRNHAIRAAVVVPLLRHERLVATLAANQSTPRAWTTQEVALVEETLEHTWAAVERTQAEQALAASEAKYRALFNSIDEGHCIIEVLFDAGQQPYDWRYIEVNQAFERNTGLANATGKTIRELAPYIEPGWFAAYGHVAQTGEPRRFEGESAVLGRWFSLYAFPVGTPGSHLVAVLFTDITARKKAEEAMRLSEARLSLALQAGRMGSFEWTSDGNRITLSAISEEVLGLQPDTRIATSDAFFALVHPDDRARHQATFEEAGRSGEDFHSVYRIVRPLDGQVRWIEERGQGTHDAADSGVCLRGVHWDVTEPMLTQQRLAEFNSRLEQRVARRTRDLQASRDLLQSVFDTNLIAMSVLEAVRDETGAVQDFRLRLVSRELERETGRTDLVGKLYAQEYPGIHEAGLFELAVRTVETGEPHGMEYFYSHEGFNKWFACQFVKLGDGIVATNLDITERRTAEQERLKNLRLLEQAEAVAGLGSWDYELTTRTLRWSDGMYQLFGLPVGSPVTPDDYLNLVVPEDDTQARQLVQRLITGAGDFEETLRLRVHGQVKTVRTKAVVLPDAQGQAVRVLGFDLDISELQRLEQDNLRLRLLQQRAMFEAVQAAQEAERKRMAESLHNGIGQILYATKLRLDRLPAPLPGTDPALATARREADQLLGEAISQTRALSHELVPTVLTDFGLAAALQDIGRSMSTPQLRLHCLVQLDDTAAPLSPALQMALYRMAQELAQNIIKHARGATQASLELETMPSWVLLRAEDNGTGFAPVPPERTGLGLRSMHDRVALLGGQLETGSVATGGAYVRIRIPLPIISAAV